MTCCMYYQKSNPNLGFGLKFQEWEQRTDYDNVKKNMTKKCVMMNVGSATEKALKRVDEWEGASSVDDAWLFGLREKQKMLDWERKKNYIKI